MKSGGGQAAQPRFGTECTVYLTWGGNLFSITSFYSVLGVLSLVSLSYLLCKKGALLPEVPKFLLGLRVELLTGESKECKNWSKT